MPLTLLVMVLHTTALRNVAAYVYGRTVAFRSEQRIHIIVIPKQETLTAIAERCKLNCLYSAATGTVRYHGNILIEVFHTFRNVEQVNCADVHSTLSLFTCTQGN